jgi:hypothetical protein
MDSMTRPTSTIRHIIRDWFADLRANNGSRVDRSSARAMRDASHASGAKFGVSPSYRSSKLAAEANEDYLKSFEKKT